MSAATPGAGKNASEAAGGASSGEAPVALGGAAKDEVPGNLEVPDSCRLLFPTSPTYYPGDTDSPCPTEAPTVEAPGSCTPELEGVRCVYPSHYPTTEMADMWSCVAVQGSEGELSRTWEFAGVPCAQSGDDCHRGATSVVSLPEAPSCALSSPTTCTVGFDQTGQSALDIRMGELLNVCFLEAEPSGCNAASLSVRFESGCAADFAVDPPELAACVRSALEQTGGLSCALGLACSSVSVGSCL